MRLFSIVLALLGFGLTSVASACDAPHLHAADTQLESDHHAPSSFDESSCPIQRHHHHGHNTDCSCFAPHPHAVLFAINTETIPPTAPAILLPIDLESAKTAGLEITEAPDLYIDSGPPPSARPSIFCIFLI